MPRAGLRGEELTLEIRFYDNGVLFEPSSVTLLVGIFNVTSGGVPITTLIPTQVSTGIYQVIWDIPIEQQPGTYYDEWTWRAVAGIDEKVQRNTFTVSSEFVMAPTQNTLTLERRLQLIETRINSLQVVSNNLVQRKEYNAIMVLFQREHQELRQLISQHKLIGH